MKKSELINLALLTAGGAPVSASTQSEFESIYDMILDDLLEERPWLFTLTLTRDLTPTTGGTNLRYKYKYILPSNAVDILQTQDINTYNLSVQEGVRIGLSVPIAQDRVTTAQSKYIFINGILHSDKPLTEIIYRRKVSPEVMTASFRKLLVYKLAEWFARHRDKNETAANEIERQSNRLHKRALRDEINRPSNPYLASIYDWLRAYYYNTGIR